MRTTRSLESNARFADELEASALGPDTFAPHLSIDELVIRFMAYADRHDRKGGKPTSEVTITWPRSLRDRSQRHG